MSMRVKIYLCVLYGTPTLALQRFPTYLHNKLTIANVSVYGKIV